MYILDWFSTIINFFRFNTLTVLGFNISYFDLFIGIFIYSALCKMILKYIFESRR